MSSSQFPFLFFNFIISTFFVVHPCFISHSLFHYTNLTHPPDHSNASFLVMLPSLLHFQTNVLSPSSISLSICCCNYYFVVVCSPSSSLPFASTYLMCTSKCLWFSVVCSPVCACFPCWPGPFLMETTCGVALPHTCDHHVKPIQLEVV